MVNISVIDENIFPTHPIVIMLRLKAGSLTYPLKILIRQDSVLKHSFKFCLTGNCVNSLSEAQAHPEAINKIQAFLKVMALPATSQDVHSVPVTDG